MHTARAFRLREELAALRVSADIQRPVYSRLEAGAVVLVLGDLRSSGLVDIASANDRYSVFAEDLLARSEPVAERAPTGAALS
ncbi:MAG TPA: hypothetical protein VFL57_17625 [Bryobacteraceae bacterium]|nr:hypothetical protein [Bryobacteraceae bacterium]